MTEETNEGSYSATESEQTEGKPQPPTKKNAEVDVDAVAMLLGLAQGGEDEAAGPSGSGSGDKSRARSKRPLGQAELLLEEAHPDLTKKGVLRLGPGDNRVRPPKAATKLLPEAKWRHIRMPDVESALEAEDWVVMWAHFTHPDVLPKPKAEGLLNFRLSHYDEEDLKKNLADITSAYELENVLKERYGVGGPNKKARSLSAAASMAVARITAAMQNQGGQAPGSLPNRTQGALAQALMGEPSQPGASLPLPIPPVGSPDHALAVQQPAPLAVQSSQELAGLLYIGAGLKDATAEGSGMPLGALVASPPATQTQAPSPELQALTHAEPAHEVEQQATTGEPQDNDAGQAAVVAMDTAAPAQPVATQAAVEATAAPVAPAVPAPPAIPDGAAAGAGASAGALAGVNLDLAALNTEAGSAQIAAALAAFPAIPPDTPLDINALRTQLMPGAVDINAILSGSFPSLPGGKLPDGAALAGLGSLPFSPASFNALMPQWNAMLANPMAWPLPAGLTLPQQGQQGNAGLLPGLAFPPGLLPGLGGEAQQLAPQLGNEGPGGGAQAKSAGRSGDKSAQGVGGDRPGRPPSYDDMVRWCVDLKRCLWQRHVPLTIEEAVAMVNDPNLCSTAGELPKAKTLVASTLRKRVLGIYKITWSQVATDSDPNANDEVTNPAVLGAAALKLKRHGMDPSALRVGAPGLQMQALAAMVGPPAQLQLPGAPMLTGLGPPPASPTGQLPSGGIPNGANGVPSAPQAQQGEGPAASSAEQIMRAHLMGMQQPVAASDMVPAPNMERGVAIPLDASTLPNISEDVRESLKRGRTQFLTSEEVYNLLVAGREYNLPLSTRPYDRPLAGSMYLFDRSRTSRFRCDGYEWKRRETHAKRKVRDEFKLNCYYVGGPEDEVQRRCYWLLDDKASDLVFVHYLPPPHVRAAFGAAGEEGSDVDEAAAPLQAPTVEELPMGGGHLGAAPGGGAQGLGMGMAGPTTVLMPPQQGGQMLVEVQELPAGIGSLPMQMPPAHLLPLMSPYHQLFSMQQGNGPAAGGNAEQQAVQPTIEAVQLKDEGGGVAAGNPAQLVTQGAAPVLGRQASSGGDANAEPADGGDGKAQLRQRIAAADINDSDSMFNAMCSLHHVAGISKADRAAVCRLWMENMLDDKQKKQLFMYIANNVEDDEAVADWIKSVIRKNGG